ncbi:hypothetical protein ACFONH_15450, partial [Streptomonospora nanhaiensis]
MSSPSSPSDPSGPGGPAHRPDDTAVAGARDHAHAVGADGTVSPGGDAARHRAEDRYAAETGTRTPPTRATTIGSAGRGASARSGAASQGTPAGGTGSPPPAGAGPGPADRAADGASSEVRAASPAASDRAGSTAPHADAAESLTLFTEEDRKRFQDRWREAQGDFVDDPRAAVHTADELVDEVLRTLTAKFADHKRTLEA